jgi:aspartyl-tRNA(Asn)/glutamyl-tRNA(Gln) amidotransferase subunit C
MEKISKQDILHVAELARIAVDESELDRYAAEMIKIIDHVDSLAEVDVTDCQPTYMVGKNNNIMRPDEPIKSLDREIVLNNAPRRDLVNIRTKGVFHE